MCTGAEFLLAAQGAGAVSSAMGAFSASKSQKSALNAQAILEDTNAKIDELNAQGVLLSGQREEQKSRLQTASIKGTQKTNIAANGIALDTDPTSTANNILTTTDVMGEIDANTIRANAISSAWGYRLDAVNHTNNALLARSGASQISPGKAAFTSLLGSASSMGTNYYSLKKVGAL